MYVDTKVFGCVGCLKFVVVYLTSPSLPMEDEPGKRHDVRVRIRRNSVVSDWLNPLSLGTMSASAYI